MFCPHCKSILRPKEIGGKRVLWCSCGYTSEKKEDAAFKEKGNVKQITVVEEVEVGPLVDAECEKCGHKKAHYWTMQTRAADEPETRFFRCEKCRHTWREYA